MEINFVFTNQEERENILGALIVGEESLADVETRLKNHFLGIVKGAYQTKRQKTELIDISNSAFQTITLSKREQMLAKKLGRVFLR